MNILTSKVSLRHFPIDTWVQTHGLKSHAHFKSKYSCNQCIWTLNYPHGGYRSHDKHLADRQRDLLFLTERLNFGSASLPNSGLHFLIARTIDLHIIRILIQASRSRDSLHSLHKPKGHFYRASLNLRRTCTCALFFCGSVPTVTEIH